jgi:hypothetical protein
MPLISFISSLRIVKVQNSKKNYVTVKDRVIVSS